MQTKNCSGSQSIWQLNVHHLCTFWMTDQVLKTHTHLKKRPEDQVKHLYLKDTEEKMNENPPRRAFVF